MKNLKFKNLIIISSVLALSVFGYSNKAYADDCTSTYGGGEKCVYDRSFDVEKGVRIGDSGEFTNKVDNVDKDDVIEFQVVIKNTGDLTVDDMKMTDFLPEEMERIGGDGLTEYWDDFKPCSSDRCKDERKVFVIKAKIKASEFDNDNDFDKCIVNKAESRYDGDKVGSDTAKVCYGKVVGLPDTGAGSAIALALAGLSAISAGTVLKKKS